MEDSEKTEREKRDEKFCRKLHTACLRLKAPGYMLEHGLIRYAEGDRGNIVVKVPRCIRDGIKKWCPLVRKYRSADDKDHGDNGDNRDPNLIDGKTGEVGVFGLLQYTSMGLEYEREGVDIDFDVFERGCCAFAPDIGNHIHVKTCCCTPLSWLIHRNDPVYSCTPEFTSRDIVIFTDMLGKTEFEIIGFASVRDLKGLAQPTIKAHAGSRKDAWYYRYYHFKGRNIKTEGIEHVVRPIYLMPEFAEAAKANERSQES